MIAAVDWERVGVMGGYHGRFITMTVNLTHTHMHTGRDLTLFLRTV